MGSDAKLQQTACKVYEFISEDVDASIAQLEQEQKGYQNCNGEITGGGAFRVRV